MVCALRRVPGLATSRRSLAFVTTAAPRPSGGSTPSPSSQPHFSSAATPRMATTQYPAGQGAAAAGGDAPSKALTAQEFAAYNRMAHRMDMFHNHFRSTWENLWRVATAGPSTMPPRLVVSTGLQFLQHLEMHHAIEEQHIFPVLAERMPEFAAGPSSSSEEEEEAEGKEGGGGRAELLRQHREIHRGMEGLEKYLLECQAGKRQLEPAALKERMESWGGVLWTHLDQEVRTLGAENMRKYWTKQEIARMPM